MASLAAYAMRLVARFALARGRRTISRCVSAAPLAGSGSLGPSGRIPRPH